MYVHTFSLTAETGWAGAYQDHFHTAGEAELVGQVCVQF